MSDVTEFSDEERERLYELTSIGASNASAALTTLLDRAIAPSAPQFQEPGEYGEDSEWTTGVIFQADGDLTGLVAILLPAAARDIVAERLIRENDSEDPEEAIESVLRELGNIVASHTMSAIADRLGGCILLSVPVLVMEDADAELASMIQQRRAERCVECILMDAEREVLARLVFAPETKPK